jgi:tripartite-type tricarboxylate transporter receptor subunit TctC
MRGHQLQNHPFVRTAIFAAVSVIGAAAYAQQNYPTMPVRIVTSGAGGGQDFIARLMAPSMSAGLGQRVIVDNRASAVIGELVARAPPDGHTLLMAGSSFTMGPYLQKVPYDPVKDFAPICMMARAPVVLVVHPSLPAKNVRELIALARAHPGDLSYSSQGTGSSSHLAAELFKAMTKTSMVRIPYRNGASELAELIGGQVQLTFNTAASMMPHVKTGKLRALAVTSLQPSALLPDLPTIAASGVPGYEAETTYGIWAPANTPSAIINRLNQEMVRFLHTSEAKDQLANVGVEIVASTPEQFAVKTKSQMTVMGKVIRDAGIKAD